MILVMLTTIMVAIPIAIMAITATIIVVVPITVMAPITSLRQE
jgi:hypothetical protein